MNQKPKQPFGIYHWDTFDNNTILVGEAKTLERAEEFVKEHYGNRIRSTGADRVDIVQFPGAKVVRKYSVG